MKKNPAAEPFNPDDQPLRLRAEAAIAKAGQAANLPTAPVDVLKLMHELQVHQIELELQNEELIRAGAELEASLEKYTDLYEFAPVGYLTLDPDGSIYQMNLTAADIFQSERSALIGRKLDALLNQNSRPVFRDYLERVFRESTSEHCEVQILIQNRPAVDLRLSATTMSGGDQCRLAIENITAIKRAEAELLKSEAKLSRAQYLAHVGSWQFDPHTQKFTWSSEVFRICGRDPGLGPPKLRLLQELIAPEDWELFNLAFQNAIHSGVDFKLDFHVVRPDGKVRQVEMVGECELDGQGRLLELLGSIQDITDRKWMEDRLRAALSEKEWLMREVHHRVKNNLEVIASLVDMQVKRTSDPKIQAGLRDLEQRIHTIALVHEQLYRSEILSQVEAQRYLEQLVQDLSQSLGGLDVQVSINACQVQLDIDKAIPLGLVVTEMVSNAFKHAFGEMQNRSGRTDLMASSGETTPAQILVSLEPEQDKLVLKVSDNGVGLPTELDWQATRTLGMRLINRLSEQLHGELTVSSHAGTCYTLIFEP